MITNAIDTFMRGMAHELLADADIPPFMPADAPSATPASALGTLTALIRWGMSATAAPADDAEERATQLARAFEASMPDIRLALRDDVEATFARDPAASSRVEVICCYPAIVAMLHYRVAHRLHQLGVPLIDRLITERAHSLTGIDIHPAATIGKAFAIDHGTGIVIGATTIIGNEVMLYQGVTLGAKNIQHDDSGRAIDQPRHPIIEDRVTIYANTTVLGRVHIGHDSVIGGNLWITHDIAPCSTIRQPKPVRGVNTIHHEPDSERQS